jgi:hypothetical protein
MACRLYNRSKQLLRIDLRGGVTLQLAPGAMSAALPEEQLYDNMFVQQWEREGLIARLPARYSEVGIAPAARKPDERKRAASDAPDKKDDKDKKDKKSKGKTVA